MSNPSVTARGTRDGRRGWFGGRWRAASVAGAAYFARKVLTPDRRRPDDMELLEIGAASVLVSATPDSLVPGRYGLWLEGGRGHLRVGRVLEHDAKAGTVRRELLGRDFGLQRPGPARWNSYYYAAPPEVSLGLTTRHVVIESELGLMPAWQIPGPGDGSKWVSSSTAAVPAVRNTCAVPTVLPRGICQCPLIATTKAHPPADGRCGLSSGV